MWDGGSILRPLSARTHFRAFSHEDEAPYSDFGSKIPSMSITQVTRGGDKPSMVFGSPHAFAGAPFVSTSNGDKWCRFENRRWDWAESSTDTKHCRMLNLKVSMAVAEPQPWSVQMGVWSLG